MISRESLVGSSTRPAAPAYTTIETRSFGVSWPTSVFIAVFTSGSLSALDIEPDTSSRKTRLAAGRSAFGASYPARPMRTSRVSASHGVRATSMLTVKGASCALVGRG